MLKNLEELTGKDFYFCYDKRVSKYIQGKGVQSITTALSPSTLKKYTIYVKTAKLGQIIREYKQLNNI